MTKKKSSISWPTILGCIGFIGISGGWLVTAALTNENKKDIEETQKDVEDIQSYITEQQTMNTSQYAINQSLLKILEKKK